MMIYTREELEAMSIEESEKYYKKLHEAHAKIE